MKTLYTFIIVLLLGSSFCANAQTKTWTNGTGNELYDDPDNWSPAGVPQIGNDVVIPANSVVNADLPGNRSADNITVGAGTIFTKSGASLSYSGGSFASGSELNFVSGSLSVRGGVLTINGELNCVGTLTKTFSGTSNNGIFDIAGTMNLDPLSESVKFRDGALLRILPSGILTVGEGNIAISFGNGTIVNEGLIQKTSGTDTFNIIITFENNDGTINVDSGSMEFLRMATLNDGEYNVNSSGSFTLSGGTDTYSGTLTGQLDGPFIINESVRLENGQDATLDFTGSSEVQWANGILSNMNSETLINQGLLRITQAGGNVTQVNGGLFRNEATMIFEDNVTFAIRNNSVLENGQSGEITLEDDVTTSTSESSTFLNNGLVQKTATGGTVNFNAVTINDVTGEIVIPSGAINFTTITNEGLITGAGAFTANSSVDLEGVIAPGNEGSGTLTYNNTTEFDSTSETIYNLEINGTTPDTEHDVFTINANAKLNGTLDIEQGFAPQLNDEFVVIMADNITECNLPAQVSTVFDDVEYTFDIVCNADNVTLLVSEVLEIEDIVEPPLSISGYPNPTNRQFTIDLGTSYAQVSVAVINMLGQTVLSKTERNTNSVNIEISGTSGLYFVTVTTQDGAQQTLKVFKR